MLRFSPRAVTINLMAGNRFFLTYSLLTESFLAVHQRNKKETNMYFETKERGHDARDWNIFKGVK